MSSDRWVACVGLDFIDPSTGRNVRVEVGEVYTGPTPEKYEAAGIVARVSAGGGHSMSAE